MNLKTTKKNLKIVLSIKNYYNVRNVIQAYLNMKLYFGLLNTFVDQKIFRGKAPWTLRHEKKDNEILEKK